MDQTSTFMEQFVLFLGLTLTYLKFYDSKAYLDKLITPISADMSKLWGCSLPKFSCIYCFVEVYANKGLI